MGLITISVSGSFNKREIKQFSAIHGGHAEAVAESIEWLSRTLLPLAIQQDHALHSSGDKPGIGFGEREKEVRKGELT